MRMVKVIKEIFGSPQATRIVEIEPARKLPEMNEDLRNSILALQANPGFRYLLDKLALQRAMLKTKHNTEKAQELRDADFLQSGIYWSGWLEAQLQSSIEISSIRADRVASSQELEAFNALRRTVEYIE